MRKPSHHDPHVIAIHEAGHVIMALHEGIPINSASIIPDADSEGRICHGNCGDQSALSMALIGITGVLAERHFFPARIPTGIGEELDHAFQVLELLAVEGKDEPSAFIKIANDYVNEFLASRSGDVLAVAGALIKQRELTAPQIDQAIADVRSTEQSGMVASYEVDGRAYANQSMQVLI